MELIWYLPVILGAGIMLGSIVSLLLYVVYLLTKYFTGNGNETCLKYFYIAARICYYSAMSLMIFSIIYRLIKND